MMSLFSSFDMFLGIFTKFSFFASSIIFMLSFYYVNYFKVVISFVSNIFLSMFYNSCNFKLKFFEILVISIFFMLFYMNFFSVGPFSFSFTSQISVVMWLSFLVWSFSLLYLLFNFPKNFISHLVPEGTPMLLVLFIFLIEIISNFIRPLTLMIRLVSNILTGHLLMIMMSNMVFFMGSFFLGYLMLNLVEMFVSLIQSYIFVTLAMLYYSESV